MRKENQQFYFKYKSLSNLEQFLDIFVNNRIYMPRYDQLNDPTEGYYQFSAHGSSSRVSELMRRVRGTKTEVRILSLTTSYDNFLMWSHYGDGHKGACIELQVRTEDEPHIISYDSTLPSLQDATLEKIEEVLSHKSPLWKYENEVRYFKRMLPNSRSYIGIKIKSLYFGSKADNKKVRLLTKLIHKIDNSIYIRKLKMEDLRATSGYDF